jgi:hypothetical protein
VPIEIDVGGQLITDCERKLSNFIANDAYELYDRQGVRAEPRPDVISRDQLRLTNTAMRGRASARALQPFLDTPLPELARIPTTVDLIGSSPTDVDLALDLLRAAVARLCVPMIKDTAATKLLYLKRPALVAISDTSVRSRLAIEAPPGPDRAVAVARAIRTVGLANSPALDALRSYCNDTTKLIINAVPLSRARILDILIWVEQARASGHPFWSRAHPL